MKCRSASAENDGGRVQSCWWLTVPYHNAQCTVASVMASSVNERALVEQRVVQNWHFSVRVISLLHSHLSDIQGVALRKRGLPRSLETTMAQLRPAAQAGKPR